MYKKTNVIPDDVLLILPFAAWIDRHPYLTNAILAIETVALIMAVLTYNFTTK